jgi:hypothetical protein
VTRPGKSSYAAAYFLGRKVSRLQSFFCLFSARGGKTFFLIFVQRLLLHVVCVVGVAATAERTDREKERKVVV